MKLTGPICSEHNEDPVYEISRYQLKPGFQVIATFLDYYMQGLPAKLSVSDKSSELCSLMHTEFGSSNEIIEIWRHGNGISAMNKSVLAGRGTPEWRASMTGMSTVIVSQRNALHRPAAFSNWK